MQLGLSVGCIFGCRSGSEVLPVGHGGGATLRRSTLGRAVVRSLLAVCCLAAPFEATAGGAIQACTGATTMADTDGITLNFASSGGIGAGSSLKGKTAAGMTGTEARRMARMPRKGKPKRVKKSNAPTGPAFPAPPPQPAALKPLRGGGKDWEADDVRPRGGNGGRAGGGGGGSGVDQMSRPWERKPRTEDVRQAEPLAMTAPTASVKGKGLAAAGRKQVFARATNFCFWRLDLQAIKMRGNCFFKSSFCTRDRRNPTI